MLVALTDGREVFATRVVDTPEELDELNEKAMEATNGNVFWRQIRPDYCTNQGVESCWECSLSSYGLDCHNNSI